MGIYQSTSEIARGLVGLHLYHYKASNCSQRCRLVLGLKGANWTSHHVDLARNEHHEPDYVEINPNAVVPTLVHNGVVVLESNDIIEYIDRRFDRIPLRPKRAEDQAAVQDLLAASAGIQGALKAVSHEYLFPGRRVTADQQAAAAAARGHDSDLVQFWRDFGENGPNWHKRLSAARGEIEARLNALESRLRQGGVTWLSGPRYGLADVSWVVNFYRLTQCGYDMDTTPAVVSWGARAVAQPEFQSAVVNYAP